MLPRPRTRALGIGMVFQHFSLFENLTVAENVALGLPQTAFAGLDGADRRGLADYGLPLDPDREVCALSVGERQRIEIVRCLMQDPKLLILDEPTSVLTPQEADQLFVTLRAARRRGQRGPLHQPPPRRGEARSATRRPSCATARWSRPATPPGDGAIACAA